MDLQLSDDQLLFDETTARFLETSCPVATVREWAEKEPAGFPARVVAARRRAGLDLPAGVGGGRRGQRVGPRAAGPGAGGRGDGTAGRPRAAGPGQPGGFGAGRTRGRRSSGRRSWPASWPARPSPPGACPSRARTGPRSRLAATADRRRVRARRREGPGRGRRPRRTGSGGGLGRRRADPLPRRRRHAGGHRRPGRLARPRPPLRHRCTSTGCRVPAAVGGRRRRRRGRRDRAVDPVGRGAPVCRDGRRRRADARDAPWSTPSTATPSVGPWPRTRRSSTASPTSSCGSRRAWPRPGPPPGPWTRGPTGRPSWSAWPSPTSGTGRRRSSRTVSSCRAASG